MSSYAKRRHVSVAVIDRLAVARHVDAEQSVEFPRAKVSPKVSLDAMETFSLKSGW